MIGGGGVSTLPPWLQVCDVVCYKCSHRHTAGVRGALYTDHEGVQGGVWGQASHHVLTAILCKVPHQTVYCASVGHYDDVTADSFVALGTTFEVLIVWLQRERGLRGEDSTPSLRPIPPPLLHPIYIY